MHKTVDAAIDTTEKNNIEKTVCLTEELMIFHYICYPL